MSSNYNLISFDDVSAKIHDHSILRNISLNIAKGQISFIVGASGSGKTTFLKLVLDLLFQEKGWNLAGNISRFPGLRMAYINQNPALHVFKNYVYEEFTTCAKEEVAQLLEKAGCLHLLNKRSLELSQGEKTIIAILRAISHKVGLIALDEVMVNLSEAKRHWLEKIILDFKQAGGTVVMADHARSLLDFSDEIIRVENGTLTAIDKKIGASFFNNDFLNSVNFSCDASENKADELLAVHVCDECIACTNMQDIPAKPIVFSAMAGDVIGIVGENGSGKSTLLDIICGIKKAARGSVVWCEKELKRLRHRKSLMALTTQESTEQFLTQKVSTELEMAISNSQYESEDVQKLIEIFQLPKLINRDIITLSQGEKQRLAIVINVVSDAKILLFDEPTYGMDKTAFAAFIYAIKFLSAKKRIIIIASHETAMLNQLTKKIVKL